MVAVATEQHLAASTDGNLAEIFLNIGKPYSALQQHADDDAVLVSLLLQNGVARHSQAVDFRPDPRPAANLLCGEVEE